jgi:hypothetical protein
MQSYYNTDVQIYDFTPPPIGPEPVVKQHYGKEEATQVFIPPPLRRMKGMRNIFDKVKYKFLHYNRQIK